MGSRRHCPPGAARGDQLACQTHGMDETAAPIRLGPRPAHGASGSATRLLILGSVRIFQPVHGYFLRRELVSWRVDEWASVHPGSIYNALRSLARAGLLEEVLTSSAGSRPARTTYRLTPTGEHEFFDLLRSALSATDDPIAFLAAINMTSTLPRTEVVDAVQLHVSGLEQHVARSQALVEEMLASPEVPDTATEVVRIIMARTAGELAWARDYLDRVRGGAYSFVGEAPGWTPTAAQVDAVLKAGAGDDGWSAAPRT